MEVLLLIVLTFGIVGVVTGAPNFKTNYRNTNMLRSRRNNWYRNVNVANDWIERNCAYNELHLFDPRGVTMYTTNGIPCMKFQGETKILTWCKKEGEFCSAFGPDCLPINTASMGGVILTLVDSRPSLIHPCKKYDVTMRGLYGSNEAGWEVCHIMVIDGLLLCVDEKDVMPDYHTVTIYPTIQGDIQWVNYRICSESLVTHCPGPAKFASIAQPEEEMSNFDWGQGK